MELNQFRLHSQSLSHLNDQAKSQGFSLDDVNWAAPIDEEKLWMPQSLINLRFLPSYELLTENERRDYNHRYALALAEQFIWFEQGIVIPILQNLLKTRTFSSDFTECLQHFIEDEMRHSALFQKLLQRAAPADYTPFEYRFYKLSQVQKWFYSSVVDYPNTFIAWIWMTIYFEERTLHISRLYAQERRQIDATFARCHQLHLLDEARHLQIDQYLLQHLYDQETSWKKFLASKMYQQVVLAYSRPRRISGQILDSMKQRDPERGVVFDQIKKECPLLAEHDEFKVKMFGDQAIPRTRALLAQYPEMKSALKILSPTFV